MKSSTMTFWQKAKRFLEPLTENKLLTFLSCIKFSTWGIYAIASVLIIRATLSAIESDDIESFESAISIFGIFFALFLFITWMFRRTDWPYLYHNIEKWIYRRYIPLIIEADNNYIEKIGTGKLISILRDGKKVWIDQLSWIIKESMKILVTGSFLLYLLAQISLSYALLLVLGLILMHVIVVWIDSIAHKHRKIRTNEQHELSRGLVRIIMSKNEILQNNSIKKEMTDVFWVVDRISIANDKINRALFFIFNLVRIFAFGIRFFVLFVIGYWVFEYTFTVTDFATTMAMIIVFESFLFDSTEFYKNFTKDFSEIEKLWEALDDAPQMRGYSTGLSFKRQDKDITIDSIAYGYNESKVFENFSLTLARGKKTALVGASWGWKTTLMKIIAGYLHPESGSISVLGNKLNETALKSYYPHIGYLTQEPWVFDATIRENLVSAITEGASKQKNIDEQLEKALRLAQCDFVFEMEKWLDTEIGERGVRLSWGQKQRLAIAKIFLKDPEIILLDEPTSALDSFSEEKITEALNTLFKWRTVIIVAHRLQTVKRADDIIVIEWGKVVERGNHDELVAKWWIYNKMLELQSGF